MLIFKQNHNNNGRREIIKKSSQHTSMICTQKQTQFAAAELETPEHEIRMKRTKGEKKTFDI
jgi:hypothetical protein